MSTGANEFRVVKSRDMISIIATLREGLPYARLTKFTKRSGLSLNTISHVMHTPRRTLLRRKAQGRLNTVESERLFRLSVVFERAVRLFDGDTAGARRWLSRRAKALGGLTPLEMAETDIGAHEVENLIGRLEHGVIT
jgi:putative toxin-antitoxin system antitoxin component (TIGR02293 family)